jgi:hypothetical protein
LASTIKIKRSGTSGNPSTLAAGELAYSYLTDNGSNGGDRLYIGTGTETFGNAANHTVVGGRYYTGLVDATISAGTLTTNAKSIPILSATGTIDQWYAGNLHLSSDTISTTDTNGNLVLNPNGTGMVQIAGNWTLPRSAGTSNYILKTNGTDTASWAEPKIYIGTTAIDLFNSSGSITSLAVDISGKATTAGTADQVSHSLSIGTGLTYSNTQTFDGSAATTVSVTNPVPGTGGNGGKYLYTDGSTISWQGVGSLLPTQTGHAGQYLTTDGSNPSWASLSSSFYIGDTSVSLGNSSGSVTTVSGLSEVDVGNLKLSGDTIATTDTNGNLVLAPNGTGYISASSAYIRNVKDPQQAQDAATKYYVDSVAQGLNIHGPVLAATTDTLASLTGGSIAYSNTNGGTITLGIALTALDGISLSENSRILIKNEAGSNRPYNGIYTIDSTFKILTRALDSNTAAAFTGGDFTFVERGATYAATGWVQTQHVTTLDSDNIIWSQFSGSGTYTAGTGITLNGNQFSISATYNGQSSITTVGTISSGTWHGDTITETYGGTNQTAYAKGDILYASATNTLTRLSAGADGQVLQLLSGVPEWASLDGGSY